MGHDKLRKFAENETFACLLQPTAAQVLSKGYANLTDHPVKGHWIEQMFGGHEGDIILVAGKGHETYQEINGVRHHFDDTEALKKLL